MILDKIGEEIILKENEKVIEKYSFEKEINFEKLTELLLSKNLTEEIELSNEILSIEERDKNLVKLIYEIITDYNEKVNEFKKFQEEMN